MSRQREVAVVIVGEDKSGSKALKDVGDEAGRAEGRVGSFAKSAAIGLAGAGVALGGFAVKAVMAGSDMNETVSKANTIFGEQGAAIQKWASGAASGFGQSKQQALEAAGTFGNLFTQLDIGADKAAGMSTKMVELASDFASFHNADPSDVLEAMTAAFRGEYDAVQRYVPTINAAAVEHKALEMGLKGTTKELTAQDKALATQALLLEGAGVAAGDYDRTSKGLANRLRELKARGADFVAMIGTALIPIVLQAADHIEAFAKSSSFQDLLANVRLRLRDVGDTLKGMDWASIKDALSGINWGALGTGMSAFGIGLGFIADHASTLVKFLPLLVAGFVALQLAQAANDAVGKNSLVGFALQIGSTLALAASNRALASSIASSTLATEAGSASKVAAVAAATASIVANIASQIASWIAMGITALVSAAEVALAWLISIGPIALVVAAVVGAAVLIVKNWDWIKETVGNVASAVAGFLGNLIGTVVNFAQKWGVLLLGPVGAAWMFRDEIFGVVQVVIGFFGRLVSGVAEKTGDLIGWVASIPGRVLGALGNLGGLLFSAGADLIWGMVNGIGSMARRLADAAVNAARGAVNAVKGFLGIGSPSKLFEGFGINIGQGLVGGLGRSEDSVSRAGASLAAASIPTFQHGTDSGINSGGTISITVGTLVGSDGMRELVEMIQSGLLKKQRRVPSLGLSG